MDDATAGADSMDLLETLSGEMEAVAKRGSFEFKETLMSGDKEEENGEPHKVLGLIWETEADRLRVDVKLNLGAKRAGLHLMENMYCIIIIINSVLTLQVSTVSLPHDCEPCEIKVVFIHT